MTGTIKVTKKLLPATDGGKFNLLIDGQAKATDVGDGGTTGTKKKKKKKGGVGTIKVTKVLAPATDSGKFNLLIDGQAKATDVGDGGTTGVQKVAPGTHTVAESAGTATDLADYDVRRRASMRPTRARRRTPTAASTSPRATSGSA